MDLATFEHETKLATAKTSSRLIVCWWCQSVSQTPNTGLDKNSTSTTRFFLETSMACVFVCPIVPKSVGSARQIRSSAIYQIRSASQENNQDVCHGTDRTCTICMQFNYPHRRIVLPVGGNSDRVREDLRAYWVFSWRRINTRTKKHQKWSRNRRTASLGSFDSHQTSSASYRCFCVQRPQRSHTIMMVIYRASATFTSCCHACADYELNHN